MESEKTYRLPFTLEERKKLQDLLKSGSSIRTAASRMNRSYSGIKTEVRKNGGANKYDANKADSQSSMRKSKAGNGRSVITPALANTIMTLWRGGHPPTTISDRTGLSYHKVLVFLLEHYTIYGQKKFEELEAEVKELRNAIKNMSDSVSYLMKAHSSMVRAADS